VFLLSFGLTGLGVLLWLGTWQVQRLGQKQEIIAQIDARVLAAPVALPANPDPVRDKYLPVAVSGTMLPGELHVLISLESFGPGYRIIAPFKLDDGRRIMVDRGFVPTEQKNTPRQMGEMQICTGRSRLTALFPNRTRPAISGLPAMCPIWQPRWIQSQFYWLPTSKAIRV